MTWRSQSAELRSASLTNWSDLISGRSVVNLSCTLERCLSGCYWLTPVRLAALQLVRLIGQILEVLSTLWGGLSPSLFKRCSFFLSFSFFCKSTADFSVLCFAESHCSSQLSRSAERTSSFEIFHFPLCCQAPCWWVTPQVWPDVSWV